MASFTDSGLFLMPAFMRHRSPSLKEVILLLWCVWSFAHWSAREKILSQWHYYWLPPKSTFHTLLRYFVSVIVSDRAANERYSSSYSVNWKLLCYSYMMRIEQWKYISKFQSTHCSSIWWWCEFFRVVMNDIFVFSSDAAKTSALLKQLMLPLQM